VFADIAGFTAWSSVRTPTQVFTLLEAIYGAFDAIAKRRGVFKVETIGDSYVAVTGLPKPNSDHAVVMAKFARDCREKMAQVTRKLEVTLGPGTADLQLRFGLNSGSCTAGVLRGEKSRFQLFGDTVNTAARMESNGERNKIHVSQTTADLLVAAGKQHWVTKREELIEAKGKGKMQTFWVEPKAISPAFISHDDVSRVSVQSEDAVSLDDLDDKTKRLVDWNVDILSSLLRQITARREASHSSRKGYKVYEMATPKLNMLEGTVLDEVTEIIELPAFDPQVARRQKDSKTIQLDTVVLEQLESFVTAVANMYRQNSVHNFEHASHVTMSVVKLLNRIIAPDDVYEESRDGKKHQVAATLHDYTYGITSDPLTQFACVFAALIHDVDHPGVPNAQLVKENTPMASVYKKKSIAEQNSVDLAWKLLMEDSYENLRAKICDEDTEMRRFRQLVVNSVMATDVMDKDLKALRNANWEKAFNVPGLQEPTSRDSVQRKATIVIEHLIQASDIAHTMQHWLIYRKWNERLFEEMYTAYRNGRAEKDPSATWYEGEIVFFDFYIIPLAKKLADCGVFGVSSDEYLTGAMKNREEWEARGREVVESMVEKVKSSDCK
jgi:class 3 adenylate cyclase